MDAIRVNDEKTEGFATGGPIDAGESPPFDDLFRTCFHGVAAKINRDLNQFGGQIGSLFDIPMEAIRVPREKSATPVSDRMREAERVRKLLWTCAGVLGVMATTVGG